MKKFFTIKLLLVIVLLILLPVFSSQVFADPDFIGTIDSPTGTFGQSPGRDVGNLIGVGIRTTFIIAGITCLAFMLWGAINWITSGGDQEKLQKAQQRIRNAVIGMIMVVLMFGLFVVIFGLVLNNRIIDVRNGFRFRIPTLDTINPDPIEDCIPTATNPCIR